MTRTLLLFVVLLLAGPGDGKKKGRQGNAFYESGKYQDAAAAYREGLSGEDAAQLAPAERFGLQHNLGAALHRGGDLDGARDAFDEALRAAPSDADYARAAYNAGNTAFARQDLEGALAHYRNALLADPASEDAKFNYEFVKRQLQQQQQQQGQNDQQQPQQQPNQGQNDPQQDQEGDQQDPEGQDEQDQQQQEQQQQDPEQEDQQQQQPEPDPNKMSPEQAERILDALQNEEEKLLRQVQQPKTRPRRVEKDW
jgi:Ca-activated chloride channel family protein